MNLGKKKGVKKYPERDPIRRAIPIVLPEKEKTGIPVEIPVPERREVK